MALSLKSVRGRAWANAPIGQAPRGFLMVTRQSHSGAAFGVRDGFSGAKRSSSPHAEHADSAFRRRSQRQARAQCSFVPNAGQARPQRSGASNLAADRRAARAARPFKRGPQTQASARTSAARGSGGLQAFTTEQAFVRAVRGHARDQVAAAEIGHARCGLSAICAGWGDGRARAAFQDRVAGLHDR